MIYKKLVKNISKSGVAINGTSADLSNYYNKQEIDKQQEAQDNKIATNETNITTLKNDLRENTNKINQMKSDYIWVDGNYRLHYGNTPMAEFVFKPLSGDKEISLNGGGLRIIDLENNNSLSINDIGNVGVSQNDIMIPLSYYENVEINNDNDIPNKKYVDTKLNDYYTKEQLSNYSVVLKPEQIKPSDNTSIDNYNDTEIVLTAPQKITCITNANGQFRTETRQDGFYINNKKAQPTINTEIMNNATKITELGDNKVMVIAQISLNNYKNNGQDLFSALPTEVQELQNVRQIEYFEYNFIQYSNNVNKVFTCYIGNIAASVYSNRIYLRNEMALPSYVTHLRFKLIYDKG